MSEHVQQYTEFAHIGNNLQNVMASDVCSERIASDLTRIAEPRSVAHNIVVKHTSCPSLGPILWIAVEFY